MLLPVLLSLLTPALSCPASCRCIGTVVKCRNVTQLPHPIPSNTTELDLSHSRLRDSSWPDIAELCRKLLPLQVIILRDNILTTIPSDGLSSKVKLDVTGNPLHCSCSTLLLPLSLFLLPDRITCTTTSNADLSNVLLAALSGADLNCGRDPELIVPAEITLYSLNTEQIIPCRHSGPGTVIWVKGDIVKFSTTQQDCSLVLRYMSSGDEGLYEVKYHSLFENKTTFVNVMIVREKLEPSIDTSSTLVEVNRKGTAKVRCVVRGSPPPSIEWLHHNTSINLLQDDRVILVDEDTLIVTDITQERVFTCRATNKLGTATANFVVKTQGHDEVVMFEWLGTLSLALLIVTGTGSLGYVVYTKRKLERLKQRCSSPGASSTAGTIFENCEAVPSTITQCEGYKMLAISTTSPPDQLICPITKECMKNPVVASDGFSYEEKAILSWFKRNATSPMTNCEIGKRLIQNHNLRTLILDIMDNTAMSDSFINLVSLSPPHSPHSPAPHSPPPHSPAPHSPPPHLPVPPIPRGRSIRLTTAPQSARVAPESPDNVIEGVARRTINPAAEVSNLSTPESEESGTETVQVQESGSDIVFETDDLDVV